MNQPTAEQALRKLEPLIGAWSMKAKSASGELWPGGGTIVFEWHDSGAHLVQRGTVDHPEAPNNISIIGCDAANGTYIQMYSDERGVCRIYIQWPAAQQAAVADAAALPEIAALLSVRCTQVWFRSIEGGVAKRQTVGRIRQFDLSEHSAEAIEWR